MTITVTRQRLLLLPLLLAAFIVFTGPMATTTDAVLARALTPIHAYQDWTEDRRIAAREFANEMSMTKAQLAMGEAR